MSPDILAKLEELAAMNIQRREGKTVTVKSHSGVKTYKDAEVTIYHTPTGRLGAILPVGMTLVKFAKVCDKCADAIEQFKNSVEENKLKL
jgi:hypothetical protein